ncbi:MAG TPA: MBL fold metallo-hydrolase [Nitrospinota bacterium]|nr:MBL fold metallo-hydrolase [Nitrospinota bacterium]
MIRLCILGSGSSGNCAYIDDGDGGILLDAGLSVREVLRRMKEISLDPGMVNGIVVTHGHIDHSRSAGALSRTLELPLYINNLTYEKIKHSLGRIDNLQIFCTGESFVVNGLMLSPFSTSHDCVDPCAFTLTEGEKTLAFITDTGSITTLIEARAKNVDYLVIESNHSYEMLMAGPYPWKLKQRVKSQLGHLSNESCTKLVESVIHPSLQGVTYAHLSQVNNNPDLVAVMASGILDRKFIPFEVASQDTPGQLLTIEN